MNQAGDLPLAAQALASHFIGNAWVAPRGRVGKSGHGREKGLAGMLGFTTLKTVAIKHN